jgi:hypothetical protein
MVFSVADKTQHIVFSVNFSKKWYPGNRSCFLLEYGIKNGADSPFLIRELFSSWIVVLQAMCPLSTNGSNNLKTL